MSGPDPRLAALHRIAELLAERALVPVATASSRLRQMETRIASIAGHRIRLMSTEADPATAGAMLRQAERLRQIQAAEMARLATARADLEQARSEAARAVGRREALAALSERQAAERKREAGRRVLR